MNAQVRSPFPSGLSAALRHKRLAGVLWLGLVFSMLPVLVALGPLTSSFDDGPFREAIVKGWDSWGVLSWLSFRSREWAMFRPSFYLAAAVAVFVHLFLVGGVIRTLLADVRRPVLRRVLTEGAALFRPTLWAFFRFFLTLAFWEALLVGGVRWLLKKIAGHDAPPNGGLASFAELWTLLVGGLVYLNVSARFDLARVALARDDSPTARGAYRVAKQRLSGSRASASLLLFGWLVLGLAVQTLFTSLGVRMSPHTNAGVFWLVAVRQLGFVVLAMTRVGFWGSLLTWEEARRPVPLPIRSWNAPEAVPARQPIVVSERSPIAPSEPPETAAGA
jgi:hypothetical protein